MKNSFNNRIAEPGIFSNPLGLCTRFLKAFLQTLSLRDNTQLRFLYLCLLLNPPSPPSSPLCPWVKVILSLSIRWAPFVLEFYSGANGEERFWLNWHKGAREDQGYLKRDSFCSQSYWRKLELHRDVFTEKNKVLLLDACPEEACWVKVSILRIIV